MDSPSLIGRTVARRYRIEELVGGGAMGDVYRARHIGLDSDVALKIMRAAIASEPKFKERFYREAKAASRLEHPNSVRVIDFGEDDDGLIYLVMEFLRGKDLLAVLRDEGPLRDERIVDILAQTLAAISLAHSLGIVHRDLKPENIMIIPDDDDDRRDCVKVCDFGIAKLNDARAFKSRDDITTALTADSALIGTPEYMSPEQARGEPLDARSDLYSVGVVLYRMLTGRLPFDAENAIGLAVKHITEAPSAPSAIAPRVNPRLEAICLRALRKEPSERHATAKEMRAELRSALDRSLLKPSFPSLHAEPIGRAATLRETRRASEPPRSSPDGKVVLPFESRRRLVGVVSILTVIASLAVWLLVWAKKPDRPERGAGLVASSSGSPLGSGARPPPLAATGSAESRSKIHHSTARASAAVGSRGPPSGAPAVVHPPPPLDSSSKADPPKADPPVSAPVPAPEYKPANAIVALQSLTADRVQRVVIERKMAEIAPRLNECYRDALFIAGAPVGGSADIHMSIDPGGHVVSVVVAPQLPPFQRCVSRLISSFSVPADAVDPGGGTADQALKLTP